MATTDLVGGVMALLAVEDASVSTASLSLGLELVSQLAQRWRAELGVRSSVGAAELACSKDNELPPAANVQQGPVRKALACSLFGSAGVDPVMAAANSQVQHTRLPAENHSSLFTNVPQPFLDTLLHQLRPTFCVEVGSWKGGSAIRIASAALAATPAGSPPPCVLCIATWLGDGAA